MKLQAIAAVILCASACGVRERGFVKSYEMPADGDYSSQSFWLVEPPTSEHLDWEWSRGMKNGGDTTIQIDRESSSVLIRSAACDTEGCNEIRAVAPHVMSALESSEGIRFTIEDVLVIRPGYDQDANSTAFVWSEKRLLPTAEELDAAYGGGD